VLRSFAQAADKKLRDHGRSAAKGETPLLDVIRQDW
jgi:hypothetical protein